MTWLRSGGAFFLSAFCDLPFGPPSLGDLSGFLLGGTIYLLSIGKIAKLIGPISGYDARSLPSLFLLRLGP